MPDAPCPARPASPVAGRPLQAAPAAPYVHYDDAGPILDDEQRRARAEGAAQGQAVRLGSAAGAGAAAATATGAAAQQGPGDQVTVTGAGQASSQGAGTGAEAMDTATEGATSGGPGAGEERGAELQPGPTAPPEGGGAGGGAGAAAAAGGGPRTRLQQRADLQAAILEGLQVGAGRGGVAEEAGGGQEDMRTGGGFGAYRRTCAMTVWTLAMPSRGLSLRGVATALVLGLVWISAGVSPRHACHSASVGGARSCTHAAHLASCTRQCATSCREYKRPATTHTDHRAVNHTHAINCCTRFAPLLQFRPSGRVQRHVRHRARHGGHRARAGRGAGAAGGAGGRGGGRGPGGGAAACVSARGGGAAPAGFGRGGAGGAGQVRRRGEEVRPWWCIWKPQSCG